MAWLESGGLGEQILFYSLSAVTLIDYRAIAAGGAVAFSGVPRPYLAAAAVGGGFYQLDLMDREIMPHNSTPTKDKLFFVAMKMGSAGFGLLTVRRFL